MSTTVYLDYQATTPMSEAAVAACTKALTTAWGNPSSAHQAGKAAKAALDTARQQVAALISAEPDSVIFTSGGTEANNMVLHTVCRLHGSTAPAQPLPHIVTTTVEHDSVEKTLNHLEATGWAAVTRVRPHSSGAVQTDDVLQALTPQTVLVTIMLANNETGTLQPVGEIASAVKAWARQQQLDHPIYIHTDAAQALGKVKVDLSKALADVDYLTVVGHKLYGPRTGALFARNIGRKGGAPLLPLLFGGGQERDYRPGTENIGMNAALGAACQDAADNLEKYQAKMLECRQYLERRLREVFSKDRVRFNGFDGDIVERLPNTLNFSLLSDSATGREYLRHMPNIHASVGSACHSHAGEKPSRILLEFGVPEDVAKTAMRWSVGRETTLQDIDAAIEALRLADAAIRARAASSISA